MPCQMTVVSVLTTLNKRTGILVSMQAMKAHGEVEVQLH